MMLQAWRHPRPDDVAGRCVGRTDVGVDRRKAKRLAHRVRARRRRDNGPLVVWTSPLKRAHDVGVWLARWGWQHRVDQRLSELDFGIWDGQAWNAIGAAAVDVWCADFEAHAPGGGEPLAALLARCRDFLHERLSEGDALLSVVGHAGWINAARWWALPQRFRPIQACDWPPPLAYGRRAAWDFDARGLVNKA